MTDPRNLRSVVVEGRDADMVVSETPSGEVRIEVVIGPDVSSSLSFSVEDANNLIAALNAVLPDVCEVSQ